MDTNIAMTGFMSENDHSATSSTHFRLLDLPTELVSIICAYAVTLPGPICLHPIRPTNNAAEEQARSKFPRPAQRTLAEPAIAQVNRLLRAEALPLFYRLNDFHASISSTTWLKRIREANKGMMGGVFISSQWTLEGLARYSMQMGMGEAVRVNVAERKVVEERLCFEAQGKTVMTLRLGGR
jgi:hypothetical protein